MKIGDICEVAYTESVAQHLEMQQRNRLYCQLIDDDRFAVFNVDEILRRCTWVKLAFIDKSVGIFALDFFLRFR